MSPMSETSTLPAPAETPRHSAQYIAEAEAEYSAMKAEFEETLTVESAERLANASRRLVRALT
jgi:Zn-dependent M32 family carboxypeptidase